MDKQQQKTPLISFYKALKSFLTTFPLLLGIILLIGFFRVIISQEMISSLFTGDMLRDTALGSVIGSVSAGNAVTSYIIGGELIKNGVSFFAVTSFIVAWVTVGIVQLPAESAIFGKRFAIARNTISFILCFVVTILVVITLRVLQ